MSFTKRRLFSVVFCLFFVCVSTWLPSRSTEASDETPVFDHAVNPDPLFMRTDDVPPPKNVFDAGDLGDLEPEVKIDIDGDGQGDTFGIRTDDQTRRRQQVWVRASRLGEIRIDLPQSIPNSDKRFSDRTVVPIGDVNRNGTQELSVFYGTGNAAKPTPAIAVVDILSRRVLAFSVALSNQTNAVAGYPRIPTVIGGRRVVIPFIAPGYGNSDVPDPTSTLPEWRNLCQFSGGIALTEATCANQFRSVSTVPFEGYFRESGLVYSQDVDRDGWDDITLVFHGAVMTVSGQTGREMKVTRFDPANGEKPEDFHSGRLYGTISIGEGARLVLTGSMPVGSFGTKPATPSRFVTLLDASDGNIDYQTKKWSNYYGFGATTFSGTTITRPTDALNGALHAFRDGRVDLFGRKLIVLNVARQNAARLASCAKEQLEVYQSKYSRASLDAFFACQDSYRQAPTTWSVLVLNEQDGRTLERHKDLYMWAYSGMVLPNGETAFLVETLPATSKFDLTALPRTQMEIRTMLTNGQWSQRRYVLPVTGRPLIRLDRPDGSIGSTNNIANLVELPNPFSTSLRAFRIMDGTPDGAVLAYNPTLDSFVVLENE